MKKINLFLIFSLFALLFLSACEQKENPKDLSSQEKIKKLHIFYTNDEHGWLEPNEDYGGAPGLFKQWEAKKAANPNSYFLTLSGGDMWTGPAISTWFKGKPMVEVMNAMGYDACAIGNHEFDFTVTELLKRKEEMNFPLLSANIIEKATGNIPSFAKPYIVKDLGGLKVGIIGLSSRSTPTTTFPAYVVDYEFTSYSSAISKYARMAKDEGAEILIVAAHLCESEMKDLSFLANSMGITLIGGGHCHQKVSDVSNGVAIIQSGSTMRWYVEVQLEYNSETKKTKVKSYKIQDNPAGNFTNPIQNIVENWKQQIDNELGTSIGYCSEKISKSSAAMANMITGSWLIQFPDADISLTNAGGIRQSIPQGDISLSTIVGVMPFNNTIVELELTGEQLKNSIGDLLVGGMTTENGYLLSDGTPIDNQTTYKVLTTDYLYSSRSIFSEYDPNPENTGIHYRQPVIDWIISKNTNASNPLNNYLN